MDIAVLPTRLTQARLVAIPMCLAALYLPVSWGGPLAAGIFVLAAITDWLDGYLARRLGVESEFGAFLDPVADKLLVAAVLVALVERHAHPFLMLAAAVIIGREITISALREWMAARGLRGVVAVGLAGKVKTAVQMLALTLLLYGEPVYAAGLAGLLLAAVLSLTSLAGYLARALPALRGDTATGRDDQAGAGSAAAQSGRVPADSAGDGSEHATDRRI